MCVRARGGQFELSQEREVNEELMQQLGATREFMDSTEPEKSDGQHNRAEHTPRNAYESCYRQSH